MVANYDARALDWDAQRAREQASAALQWQAEIDLGHTQMRVRLVDREGRPVEADAVSVAMFHKAEAAHRQTVTLHAIAPGLFVGPARLHRDGAWSIELEATRGDDRFYATRTIVLE